SAVNSVSARCSPEAEGVLCERKGPTGLVLRDGAFRERTTPGDLGLPLSGRPVAAVPVAIGRVGDMDKGLPTAAETGADMGHGAASGVGGFGLCGVPFVWIDALLERGSSGLSIVSNNCGTMGRGLGRLLDAGRIMRAMGSYVGENKELARRYLTGQIELE